MTANDTYDQTVSDIEETLGIMPGFLEALPDGDVVNEWPTFKKYLVGDTEIPPKYRELIGLAVAANIKCPYCTHFHKGAAQLHGATEDEIAEVYYLASYTARYSSMLHAQEYDEDTFHDEVEQIAAHFQEQMGAD